jgi:hypothetical protein
MSRAASDGLRMPAFTSPSAAGAVVYGLQTAGPMAWRSALDGKTYGEWEAAQIAG